MLIRTKTLAVWSVVAIALGLAYGPLGPWLYDRFTATGTYYSHGFLVPLVTAYLLWAKREAWAKAESRPTLWGLTLLLPGLFIMGAGARVEFPELTAFSFPLVLAGLVWYAQGAKRLSIVALPLIFLFFMIPLPVFVLARMAQTLKIAAVDVGIDLASLIGTKAVAEGAYVELATGARLLVGDPCSGLRSLISLAALSVLLAFGFSRLPLKGKVVLLLLAAPIAFFGNAMRIAALCTIAAHRTDGLLPQWAHDITGYAVYVVALVGLLSSDRLLSLFLMEKRPCPPSALA